MATEAAIALGGNVGDAAATFERAIAEVCELAPARLLARSANFETPPWGDTDQPAFLNACILVDTAANPHALLGVLHDVERRHGRDRARERRWGPRTLDLDLLTYGDIAVDSAGLTLPHPRLKERAFVLAPLAEIAPTMVIDGKTVAAHLAGVGQTGIRRVPP